MALRRNLEEIAVNESPLARQKRSSLKRKKIRALAWCAKAIRDNGKKTVPQEVTREIALSLFSSFYAGALSSKKQEHWEKKLSASPGTFTKYSATYGLAIFTGLEYLGVFKVVSPLLDLIPGVSDLRSVDQTISLGFWTNFAVSAFFNIGVRFPLAQFKGTRIPPPSLYALLPNTLDSLGRRYSSAISNKLKTAIHELRQDSRELMRDLYPGKCTSYTMVTREKDL